MVVLRFSLELRSPGCMHFVLESVSPKPPYLIENRTAHPFRYRQSLRQGRKLAGHSFHSCSWYILQVMNLRSRHALVSEGAWGHLVGE